MTWFVNSWYWVLITLAFALYTAGVAKMKKELKDWQETARLLKGGETA